MPAPAAWRRLCAIVPVALAALVATTVLAAPGADAIGQMSTAGVRQKDQQEPRLPPVSFRINHAANVALAHLGDPYHYGSAGPGSFDCSGLAMFSYGHARLQLPRTAAGQYAAVRHILKQNMDRGDLVFFHDGSGHVYHVGIFLYWNSRHQAVIVHAPHPGTNVQRSPVWTSSWYAGTRRPMH
jgi:cell wall-associated NlpC family hydrolase